MFLKSGVWIVFVSIPPSSAKAFLFTSFSARVGRLYLNVFAVYAVSVQSKVDIHAKYLSPSMILVFFAAKNKQGHSSKDRCRFGTR
jgi:hypothetical protein